MMTLNNPPTAWQPATATGRLHERRAAFSFFYRDVTCKAISCRNRGQQAASSMQSGIRIR